nr:glycosyltransferase family 39 protein [Chloroflexota bacterium]
MSADSQRFSLFTCRRIGAVILIAALCFVLAVFAQRNLDRKVRDYRGYLPYGVAAVAFALAFGNVALEESSNPDEVAVSRALTKLKAIGPVVAVSLLVALLGCLDFSGNRFRPLGLMLWVGGLCLCMGYLYVNDSPTRLGEWVTALATGKTVAISRKWLLLALAMLVGALLRLQQLDVVPADIGWDLPYNFTDALSILRGEYRIFFPANLGREGLFFYLIALVARFAPLSHFSLKLTSALVGILTIPALYLAARRLFPESVAFGAAFLLAVNRWHIVLSRAGFRVILLPLFSILVLYAFVRALQSYRPFDFALAGLVLGLGFHTYFPYLFVPGALVLALLLLILGGRRLPWRVLLPLLAIMFAVALVVYAPLIRYALENPKEYIARAALQARLLKGDERRTGLNLSFLMDNMRTTLLMFNVYGDGNSRFNVPAFRHFGFVSGVLLVLGSFYALRRWRHENNGILLAFFFVLMLPSGLMALPRELPNIFRASGTIGPGLVLAALPLPVVGRCLRDLSSELPDWDFRIKLRLSSFEGAYEFVWQLGRRGLLLLLPAIAMVLLLVFEYRETRRFYFRDFVNVLPDKQNVSVAKEMARQIETYGDPESSFIKVWPHWFDGRALLMYLRQESEKEWNPYFYLDKLDPNQPPLSLITERALFILHPADQEGLFVLRNAFAHSTTKPYLFPDGTPAFVLVYVER